MEYKYRFTVFTPCYNSSKFIHRVIERLESQTYKNFEWLVIDDASTDNTVEIILDYIKKSQFPINFIRNSETQMLTKNINIAFQNAKGEFIVFLGHDDKIMPEALEVFNYIWSKFGNSNISGIKCLCQDQFGKLIGKKFPEDLLISDYFTITYKLNYDKELFGCTRTDVLREFYFDTEFGSYIPESVLWGNIGMKYKTIWVNKILRIYYIEPENKLALTKSGRKKYADGINYLYLKWINDFEKFLEGKLLFKLRIRFAYGFYGILSKKKIISLIKSVNLKSNKILVLIFYPLAFITYILLKITRRL